jgi:hypothetical protein
MPRTNRATVFDIAGGQAAAGVRAIVIDDVRLALVEKYGKLQAGGFEVFRFAFDEFGEGAERGPRHGNLERKTER